MALKKRLTVNTAAGSTVYCSVRRELDDFLIDDVNGKFAKAPVDPFIALTEDSTFDGVFEKDEDRSVWSNGNFTAIYYKQAGGSPVPSADTVLLIEYRSRAIGSRPQSQDCPPRFLIAF